MTRAALAAISHGTSSPGGQAAVAALVAAVAAARSDLRVVGGFVDVQQPDVATTLECLPANAPVVVVPLLLSAGYHVHVDLRMETDGASMPTTVSAALGPDERLTDVLVERLGEVGYQPDDELILAAAGSSDERAIDDCRRAGTMLARRLGRPVEVAFISAASPRVDDAVRSARRRRPGARIVVSTYLLAPGYFDSLARAAGADIASESLLTAHHEPSEALVAVVLERYRAATRELVLS